MSVSILYHCGDETKITCNMETNPDGINYYVLHVDNSLVDLSMFLNECELEKIRKTLSGSIKRRWEK